MAATSSDAAPPADAAPLKPLQGGMLALMTIAVAFSTFMEVLDMTIVNVAVPHIAGSLAVSPSEGTWAISSYSMASAIMQPLTGWIAKRFGEVRTFVFSVFLFVVFSMLCGLATSMPMLVVGRLLQGAGSGPMVALALSLLLANYPKSKQGIALALWAMTVVIAPVLRADPWRLDHRQFHLAVDLLYQPAGRHHGRRDDLVSAAQARIEDRCAHRSMRSAWCCWWQASAACSSCSTTATTTTGSPRR
jgi:hypothetical protein